MVKKFISLVIISIILMSFVIAEVQTLGTFKKGEDVELQQIGAGFTDCHITSVLYPNSTEALGLAEMTKNGNQYNYTFSNTGTDGKYIVNGYCTDGSGDTVWSYDFDITPSGMLATISQGYLSIGLLIGIILIMFFFSMISFKLMDYEKLYPIALFFLLVSIIIAVYGLYLGVVFSRDYLFSSTAAPQSALFIGILFGLVGMMFISLLLLILAALREIRERKSIQQHGEGWNSQTKQYNY